MEMSGRQNALALYTRKGTQVPTELEMGLALDAIWTLFPFRTFNDLF